MRYFVILTFFLFSCDDGAQTLPSSTGTNSEVIFVVADALWESGVDSLAYATFGKTIEGINQNESAFRVVQVNQSEFKSILKTHKNIVIITEDVHHSSQKNKWAKGQFVAQLNWDNNRVQLLKELNKLVSIVSLKEVKYIRNTFAKLSQKNAEKEIFNHFGIEVIIPKEYEIIFNSDSVFWATFNPPKSEEIKNILTFSFIPKTTNLQAEVLQNTDNIFAKYLKGEREGSFVKIEPSYPPYYNDNNYRGLWKLEFGFMGGPFLIKTYFIDDKIVVNVGLIFAPQSRKRSYIKELEAIL
jgi:hypothetical protein